MIFDRMENAKQYEALGPAWRAAFAAMERYDAAAFAAGKTEPAPGLAMMMSFGSCSSAEMTASFCFMPWE